MRLRLILPLLLVSIPATAGDDNCHFSDQDRATVSKLPRLYRDSWFKPDAERAVMSLFTAATTILPHHGVAPRTGHEQVKAFWFPPNMASFELLKLTMDPQNVEGCGNVAYVWGTQSVEWKMKEDPKITFNAGTFLMVLRKAKGQWLIDRLMWDDPPNQTR